MDPFLLILQKGRFKFVNFQMFIILSKRLVWLYIVLYIKHSFKARCSIEFAGGVNKTYYSVRQISRIQYKLTVYCVRWNNIPRSDVQLVGCCLVLLYRLAQYITNTIRFGLRNFGSQISNSHVKVPTCAASVHLLQQESLAACSLQLPPAVATLTGDTYYSTIWYTAVVCTLC